MKPVRKYLRKWENDDGADKCGKGQSIMLWPIAMETDIMILCV